MPSYMKQEKRPHVSQKEAEEMAAKAAADQAEVQEAQARAAETEETDTLLDEIDSMIEENEVLVNFRQRGGE